MPTNQLDVFLSLEGGDGFERWADSMVRIDENMCKFLRTTKKERAIAARRNPAYVLFRAWPDANLASIAYYADFVPAIDRNSVDRILAREGLMDDSMVSFFLEIHSPELGNRPHQCIERAYKYLHADLAYMDYEIDESDMHRIIMPYTDYAFLQRIGNPVDDQPLSVEIEDIKLVPFFPAQKCHHILKPTLEVKLGK